MKLTRRIAAALGIAVFAVIMTVGWSAPAEASFDAPAAAETVSHNPGDASSVCNWWRVAKGWGDYIGYYRVIHYGTAHLYQCTTFIAIPGPDLFGCFQFVYGWPGPVGYNPVKSSAPYCW